ncbi:hypothetical protein SAMN06265338_1315 [Rhodoblastus acidophilus]|uniref:Uncharacterized protein n=1 Tax=Rhodoblastus acidophilus TaxID=1074 RepID=A0A212SEA5_RHOAC|nr:hypothetical protein [Rhodoblastus acidophilus]MCW2319016.1 hypothetical protein [Rhodoblastus acidophilus]PPQ35000.1 hypothetical protein CKO16_21325 [Rhodoblastus acidophilus]RAI20017.1 hypothetical protein CH337_11025 [Rhodoblastus acidophilus]SNB83872.1 hypothetical protein SAMN06265338_1315 [Rhodoblastus acidophilus]
MSKNEAEAAAELAIVDVLYARAELVAFTDAQALSRAIEHLDQALANLASHAPVLIAQNGAETT